MKYANKNEFKKMGLPIIWKNQAKWDYKTWVKLQNNFRQFRQGGIIECVAILILQSELWRKYRNCRGVWI
jgi:hypothetical protein